MLYYFYYNSCIYYYHNIAAVKVCCWTIDLALCSIGLFMNYVKSVRWLFDWLLHWLISAKIVKSTFVSALISHPCKVIINFQYITKMREVSPVHVNITGKEIQWNLWRKCFTASAFLLWQTDAKTSSVVFTLDVLGKTLRWGVLRHIGYTLPFKF